MPAPVLLLTLALLAGPATAARGPVPPKGWRVPTPQELSEPEREKSPSGFSIAIGDFDGDGREDLARLLVRKDGTREGLWVHRGKRWELLDAYETAPKSVDPALAMYVATRSPGVIAYACFDDSDAPCDFGAESTRPKLELDEPSISYYRFASAESLFFWSRKHRKFLRVWLSD